MTVPGTAMRGVTTGHRTALDTRRPSGTRKRLRVSGVGLRAAGSLCLVLSGTWSDEDAELVGLSWLQEHLPDCRRCPRGFHADGRKREGETRTDCQGRGSDAARQEHVQEARP
eukprot:2047870-Rhodomonas_salina.1